MPAGAVAGGDAQPRGDEAARQLLAAHVLRVYGAGLLLRLKEYREHRLDTWLRLITRLIRFGVQLAFIGVAFSFVDDLGGWTKVNDEFFDPDNGSVARIESDAGVSTDK